MSELDQLPEHDSAAEWSLVACVCEKPDILGAVDSKLFYDEAAKAALQFIARQISTGLTDLTVFGISRLWRENPHQARTLLDAINGLHSPEHWPTWLSEVQELHRRRTATRLAAEMSALVAEHAPAHKINEAAAALSKLNELELPDATPAGELIYSQIESEYADPDSVWGERTGLEAYDRITYGLHPGTMVVIAARPANGKSALAIQIGDHVAERKPVVFYSLEMPRKALLHRLVLGRAGVSRQMLQNRTLTAFQISAIRRETLRLNTIKLVIQDTLFDLSEILADMDAQARSGCGLMIVDYLQKVTVKDSRENYFQKVGEVSRALQLCGLRYKIPVIALAQISRGVEKEDRTPGLSDLKDSGQIEQDADVVAFLHPNGERALVQPTKLIVAKHREGPTDTVNIGFHREFCRFVELEKISREDRPHSNDD